MFEQNQNLQNQTQQSNALVDLKEEPRRLQEINLKIEKIAQNLKDNPARYNTPGLHTDLKSLSYALMNYRVDFGSMPSNLTIPKEVLNLITKQLKEVESTKIDISISAPPSPEKEKFLNGTLRYAPTLSYLLNEPFTPQFTKLIQNGLQSYAKDAFLSAKTILAGQEPNEDKKFDDALRAVAPTLAVINIFATALGKPVFSPIRDQIKNIESLCKD